MHFVDKYKPVLQERKSFLTLFGALTILCKVGTRAYFANHQKNSAKELTNLRLLPVLDYPVNMCNSCNEDYVFWKWYIDAFMWLYFK